MGEDGSGLAAPGVSLRLLRRKACTVHCPHCGELMLLLLQLLLQEQGDDLQQIRRKSETGSGLAREDSTMRQRSCAHTHTHTCKTEAFPPYAGSFGPEREQGWERLGSRRGRRVRQVRCFGWM